MPDLKVVSEYQPAGDQPQAIDKLAQGLENGLRAQVLKGAHAARCKRIPALPAREGQRAAGIDPRLIIRPAAQLRIVLSFKRPEIALPKVRHDLRPDAGIQDGRRLDAPAHGAGKHA